MTQIGYTNTQVITPKDQALPTYTAIVNYQEYSTVSSWSLIFAFVFCSSTLPVEPNQVPTPLSFDNNKQAPSGLNSATANIITDISTDTGAYRPFVYTCLRERSVGSTTKRTGTNRHQQHER